MPRVKRGVTAHARHKKVLDKAKGYRGGRNNLLRTVKETLVRAEAYAFRDRRARKREFRRLWITRISAACRQRDISYSLFMNGLKKANIELDRKMLSEIAIHDSVAFDKIVEEAKAAA